MRRIVHRWGFRVAAVTALLTLMVLPIGGQSGAKKGEWTTYGADTGNTRYSPLDQVNADNFNKLEIAWRFKTESLGPRPESCRGAASPRSPSRSLCIQISSPLAASSATTARRVPAVE